MTFLIIALLSLIVFGVTFVLAEWLARGGSLRRTRRHYRAREALGRSRR